MSLEVALKVDVCNRHSLDAGVPGLMALLAEFDVQASFCVAFGPDRSGLALRRVFRPGFIGKMVRTRAPRMYGWKTLMRGTLLPAVPVGESGGPLLRELVARGHEVGLHGFDHVGWHEGAAHMDEQAVRGSLARACEGFEEAVGHAPRFSGAPAWQMTDVSLLVQEALGFDFASDTRDGPPFRPMVNSAPLATLQLPTALATSDELLGSGAARTDELAPWYLARLEPGPQVIGLHAEAEGLHFSGWLRRFLGAAQAQGVRFTRLSSLAESVRASAPTRPVEWRRIPGRADPVACPQRPE
jgi:undecaprenyl phosphate-alpha-L-ara4FN deformylase